MAYVNPDNECRFSGRLMDDPKIRTIQSSKGDFYSITFALVVRIPGQKELGQIVNFNLTYNSENSTDVVREKWAKGVALNVSAHYSTRDYEDNNGKKQKFHEFIVVGWSFTPSSAKNEDGGNDESSNDNNRRSKSSNNNSKRKEKSINKSSSTSKRRSASYDEDFEQDFEEEIENEEEDNDETESEETENEEKEYEEEKPRRKSSSNKSEVSNDRRRKEKTSAKKTLDTEYQIIDMDDEDLPF